MDALAAAHAFLLVVGPADGGQTWRDVEKAAAAPHGSGPQLWRRAGVMYRQLYIYFVAQALQVASIACWVLLTLKYMQSVYPVRLCLVLLRNQHAAVQQSA